MEQKKTRTAYSGVPGCFAEEAAAGYFAALSPTGKWADICEMVPCVSFRGAMQAVADGKADCAVLPVENSSTGSVLSNYDLLNEYGFFIIGEYTLGVSQCLMAPEGVSLPDITEVFSHEQGLAQSRDFSPATPGNRPPSTTPPTPPSWWPNRGGRTRRLSAPAGRRRSTGSISSLRGPTLRI